MVKIKMAKNSDKAKKELKARLSGSFKEELYTFLDPESKDLKNCLQVAKVSCTYLYLLIVLGHVPVKIFKSTLPFSQPLCLQCLIKDTLCHLPIKPTCQISSNSPTNQAACILYLQALRL